MGSPESHTSWIQLEQLSITHREGGCSMTPSAKNQKQVVNKTDNLAFLCSGGGGLASIAAGRREGSKF